MSVMIVLRPLRPLYDTNPNTSHTTPFLGSNLPVFFVTSYSGTSSLITVVYQPLFRDDGHQFKAHLQCQNLVRKMIGTSLYLFGRILVIIP